MRKTQAHTRTHTRAHTQNYGWQTKRRRLLQAKPPSCKATERAGLRVTLDGSIFVFGIVDLVINTSPQPENSRECPHGLRLRQAEVMLWHGSSSHNPEKH